MTIIPMYVCIFPQSWIYMLCGLLIYGLERILRIIRSFYSVIIIKVLYCTANCKYSQKISVIQYQIWKHTLLTSATYCYYSRGLLNHVVYQNIIILFRLWNNPEQTFEIQMRRTTVSMLMLARYCMQLLGWTFPWSLYFSNPFVTLNWI